MQLCKNSKFTVARQAGRQTDRITDRQTKLQTDRQKDRRTDRYSQIDKQIGTDGQIGKHTCQQAGSIQGKRISDNSR